jgi:methyltransferase OMS1, mitochondrial
LLSRRTNSSRDVGTSARAPVSPRAMTIFGVGILAISTYCGYLYASYGKEVEMSRSLSVPEDVSDRFNQIAHTYDAKVDLGERLMGLNRRRKELVRMARGDVLEVSCGTGRNMAYYQLGARRGVDGQGKATVRGCRSVTFVDLSPEMIEVARTKFETIYPNFRRVAFAALDAREVVAASFSIPKPLTAEVSSTAPTMPSSTPGHLSRSASGPYFDTVVETMGLCSTPDPVGLLRHLGTITDPDHGQILLLEHGRSHYRWLNHILDNLATAHAHRFGCWWNRDIGQVVVQSGLEIVEIKRWHLGTTWQVILRPPKPPVQV